MSFLISTGRLISASVSRSSSLKAKRVSPSGRPLQVERADYAVLGAAGRGAQHLHRKPARGIVGRGKRVRCRQPAGDDRDVAAFGCPRQTVTNSEPRPRSVPSESQITSMSGLAASSREMVGSASVRSTACGSGLSCLIRTRAAAGGCIEISRLGFAERDHGHAAIVGLGAGDDVVGGAQPRVPACGSAEAVVDQQRDRRRSGRGRDRRIPQRTRGGEDDERREREPQQCQPPRRAGRRVFLRLDVEQQPRRRKLDPPRPRRNEPQDPPQHRQAEQAQQHERRGKAERQAHHADLPSAMPCGRRLVMAASLPSPIRACIAIRRSFAGAIGAVDGEAPAELGGFGANFVAVAREPRGVVGAPVLGAAGGDLANTLRLGELDAAGIGEGLFRRIDDLDEMALRAVAGELGQDRADLFDRAPQVGQHDDLRQRGRRKAGRQARALGRDRG